ncbi:MAG: hypothetical protein WA865_13525 [Spirulinaceae cyanobacterium]
MLEIRYSVGEDIEVAGTSTEFQALHHELLRMVGRDDSFLYVETSTSFEPDPYDSCLVSIEFKRAKSNEIWIDKNSLVVQGTDEFLQNLAGSLPRDAEQPSSGISYHIHYDPISDVRRIHLWRKSDEFESDDYSTLEVTIRLPFRRICSSDFEPLPINMVHENKVIFFSRAFFETLQVNTQFVFKECPPFLLRPLMILNL